MTPGDYELRLYDPREWPHGLRCTVCSEHFLEDEEIRERLVAMSYGPDGEPAPVVQLLCAACDEMGEL